MTLSAGAVVMSLTLAACGQAPTDISRYAPEAVARLVSSVTTGPLSSGDPIEVRFLEAQVETSRIGDPVERGLLTVSPSVRGTGRWTDTHTLSFAPSRPLTPGASYTARVDLRRLQPGSAPFSFAFQVAPREIADLVGSFVPVQAASPELVRFEGSLRLTEPVAIPSIRRDASLVIDGARIPLLWSGSDDGLSA